MIGMKVGTIGFFDGVHKGHRFLLKQVTEEAGSRNATAVAVTFPLHPMAVLMPDFKPELLTVAEEKVRLLKQSGVDQTILLPFTPQLAGMSARKFMQEILVGQLGLDVLVVGYDHRFGKKEAEMTAADEHELYRQIGRELGLEVMVASQFAEGGEAVSSSQIRMSLQRGRIREANSKLGYEYFLNGVVVDGFKIGRTLGFPTANIRVSPDKLLPADGAYAVRVKVEDGVYEGMLNIGCRPTFQDNADVRSVEVHLLDFHDDIYSEQIHVSFVDWLRPELRFDNTEELCSQLEKDLKATKEIFSC